MRVLAGLRCSVAIILVSLGSARAEPIPWSGTVQLRLPNQGVVDLDNLLLAGTGVGTVNASGGLGHLDTLRVGNNDLHGILTVPLTDPAAGDLASVVLEMSLRTGTISTISGAPPVGGALPLAGVFRLCIIAVSGCPFSIDVPLTANGTAGAGLGGQITVSGFAKSGVKISVLGNPWTIGSAALTGLPTANGGFTTSLAFGFAHGPASVTSSTAKPGGVIQLVTPLYVDTNVPALELSLLGVLTVHFTPEPGTLLLVASGLLAIAMGARQRDRSAGPARDSLVRVRRSGLE